MKRRDFVACLAAAAGLSSCARRAPAWVRERRARFGEPIALPPPPRDGGMTLQRALATRRSMRAFRPDPLPLATVVQLLWAGQGVTRADGKRTAPSAGALYPLELYAVTSSQVMHYLPAGHRVEVRATADLRAELKAAAFGQEPVAAAPVVLVIASVADRTRRKYGPRASAFVEREVGHAAQNVLLSATALDLAAVPIGSVDGARAAVSLALPPDQRVHYLVPVGHRP